MYIILWKISIENYLSIYFKQSFARVFYHHTICCSARDRAPIMPGNSILPVPLFLIFMDYTQLEKQAAGCSPAMHTNRYKQWKSIFIKFCSFIGHRLREINYNVCSQAHLFIKLIVLSWWSQNMTAKQHESWVVLSVLFAKVLRVKK